MANVSGSSQILMENTELAWLRWLNMPTNSPHGHIHTITVAYEIDTNCVRFNFICFSWLVSLAPANTAPINGIFCNGPTATQVQLGGKSLLQRLATNFVPRTESHATHIQMCYLIQLERRLSMPLRWLSHTINICIKFIFGFLQIFTLRAYPFFQRL